MSKSKKNRRQNPRQARRDNIEWWIKYTILMTVALSSIIGCESMVML